MTLVEIPATVSAPMSWPCIIGIVLCVLVAALLIFGPYWMAGRRLRDIKDCFPSRTMTIHPDGRVTWSEWKMPSKDF